MLPLFRVGYRIEYFGRENIGPAKESCLIVCNHNMGLDWGMLLTAFPASFRQRITVAAGSEDIFGTAWRRFGGQIIGNAFPFAKEGVRIRESLEFSQGMLDQGWSVLLFSEGERKSGEMRPFKPGIGWLVARTGAEVLPVRIDILKRGLFDRGNWRSPRGHVRVFFGPRIRPDGEQSYEGIALELEQAVRGA
jgi:1-acyl-sn-glycerol-3-phosphate acyltransferase